MQIVPFLTHYQLVYINFDFSSFSLISCKSIKRLLEAKRACFGFELHENILHILDGKRINGCQKNQKSPQTYSVWGHIHQ